MEDKQYQNYFNFMENKFLKRFEEIERECEEAQKKFLNIALDFWLALYRSA